MNFINNFICEEEKRFSDDLINKMLKELITLKKNVDDGKLKYLSKAMIYQRNDTKSYKLDQYDLNFDSSYNYLDRKTTRDKMHNVLKNLNISIVHYTVNEFIGLIFFDLIAISKGFFWDETYTMDMYPCYNCPCFKIKKIEK